VFAHSRLGPTCESCSVPPSCLCVVERDVVSHTVPTVCCRGWLGHTREGHERAMRLRSLRLRWTLRIGKALLASGCTLPVTKPNVRWTCVIACVHTENPNPDQLLVHRDDSGAILRLPRRGIWGPHGLVARAKASAMLCPVSLD
jgi:hypothetical protein